MKELRELKRVDTVDSAMLDEAMSTCVIIASMPITSAMRLCVCSVLRITTRMPTSKLSGSTNASSSELGMVWSKAAKQPRRRTM